MLDICRTWSRAGTPGVDDGQPIYQLRKFAHRNKALVTGVVVAFITLVIGVILTSWQALVATRAQMNSGSTSSPTSACTGAPEPDRRTDARGDSAHVRIPGSEL